MTQVIDEIHGIFRDLGFAPWLLGVVLSAGAAGGLLGAFAALSDLITLDSLAAAIREREVPGVDPAEYEQGVKK